MEGCCWLREEEDRFPQRMKNPDRILLVKGFPPAPSPPPPASIVASESESPGETTIMGTTGQDNQISWIDGSYRI